MFWAVCSAWSSVEVLPRFHLCLQCRWGHHLHLRMVVVICGRGGRLGDGRCGDDPGASAQWSSRLDVLHALRGYEPASKRPCRGRCSWPSPPPLASLASLLFRCSLGLGRALRSPALAVDRRRANRRFVLDSPVDCSRFAFIDWSAKRSRLRLAPHVPQALRRSVCSCGHGGRSRSTRFGHRRPSTRSACSCWVWFRCWRASSSW